MMKRIVLSVILILSIILPLNSAVIMTKDNVDHGDFRSPGRLVDIEKTIHFGFEAEIVSDIDELDFLTDPVSAFDDSVEVVADYLASQDISFWYHNPDIISALSSIDSAFPSMSDGDDLFIAEIKDYFTSRFLSDEYGSANRTHAMADVFSSGIYPPLLSSSVGGDMDLAFRLYGGKISHGSGWDLRFDLYLDSLDSLLASYKDGEYEYGNNLVAELSMNIGSAEYVIDDVLSVGISVSPNIFFKTSFLNSDLINARLDDQILSIFASNNYYFGAGIGLNFGIMYGMSAFRLSNELGISRKDAAAFIEMYFQRYSGVRSFVEKMEESARRNGYVRTKFGHIREVLGINSSNKVERAGAERVAVNTVIQGTAAEIMKLAMISIDKALTERNLETRILLQVHDELIFEVPEAEEERVAMLVRDKMENAVKLSVPLRASLEFGASWGDMH